MLNKVILIGRLCAEPELKYLPANGTAVANFTLAVNRKFNKDETDFIDIVVWKKPAENCAEYLGKGSLCAVDGRIQVRTYEDKEGKKRKVTEVVAEDVRFLDSKNKSDGPRQKHEEADWSEVGADIEMGDDSEEIPF